jgi:membrane protease YdiL (CAAX protease family)
MSESETLASRLQDAPRSSPLRALPKSLYVYLALLILSFVLPPVLQTAIPKITHHGHATPEGALSDQDFEKYLSAETETRTLLFTESMSGLFSSGTEAPTSSLLKGTATEELKTTIADYRALSGTTHVPNMDRRILILQHHAGLPLDETTLTRTLPANLRLAKTPESDIAAEIDLWRRLYGAAPIRAPKKPPFLTSERDERRIQSMHLRFLENQALADLYHASVAKQRETDALGRLHRQALRAIIGNFFEGLTFVVGGLVGLVLLVVFAVSAATGKWYQLHRVGTASVHLKFGDLMDAFLFYLTFYRCLGLVVGLIGTATDWQPDPHGMLILDASLQIGVGAIALLYAARKARSRDTTLADIGMTTRSSVLSDIGYGLLGYCANLPLMIVMGLISHAIFRHNTNTTPNPVLPLMVGTHDLLSRVLIFVMASLAAPFIEETFFRGVLFTGLRTRYGWSVSALISAACFAAVHPMQDWLPIFTLGFSFAVMREMRQSLIPGMTAHFVQNTLSFLFITNLFS